MCDQSDKLLKLLQGSGVVCTDGEFTLATQHSVPGHVLQVATTDS